MVASADARRAVVFAEGHANVGILLLIWGTVGRLCFFLARGFAIVYT